MDNEPYGDKNEALDRACEQIPALLNDADLVNFDVYEKIVIELTEYDEDDASEETFTVTKNDGGFSVEHRTHEWWSRPESIDRAVIKKIDRTAVKLNYFRLLCREIYASARCEAPSGSYGYTRSAHLFSADTEVCSDVITIPMLAVLSHFDDLPGSFFEYAEDPDAFPQRDHPKIKKRDAAAEEEARKRAEIFFLRYVNNARNEEQTFTIRKREDGSLDISHKLRKDGTEEGKGAWNMTEASLREKYPGALDALEVWSRKLDQKDASAPFTVTVNNGKTQTFRFMKIEKRLLDLINWFSPEELQIPKGLIVDNKNTVFLKISGNLPAGAYENNLHIRYLRIIAADYERGYTIGKNAFKDSSLTHVDLLPMHFGYNGTGLMPAVKEGAFDGCALEDVLIYNNEVYLGALPSERGYSLKISRITKKEDKRKYQRRRECFEGIIYQIESRPLRADPEAASVTVPEGRIEIVEGMFRNCRQLARVILPASIRMIRARAFNNCPNLKTVCYRGSEEQWKKIPIGPGNDALSNVTIVFNSKDGGQT